MKISILMMMNKIKHDMKVPECLKRANITILHKKNCKLDLNNWRGVFVCSELRNILMKLIHDRTYELVSSSMTGAQIGARRKMSVRNHIFILNSILSDVLSSKKKNSIDLNILNFKQMFDCEELNSVLNSFYDAGVKDDMFCLKNEANKDVTFVVKTPTGLTDQKTMRNKIMQGDVLSPLMSSNFVDKNIGKVALSTGNVYMYKNKVIIPPLMMQDDTCKVDVWEEAVIKPDGIVHIEDNYLGEEAMKKVQSKKYFGDIISQDMKNTLNIKEKNNKAVGIVKKISTCLYERPYGRHTFRAAKLLREGLLLGSMLNNCESWVNITKCDLDNLEKPDTMVQRSILTNYGNPSKVFMSLELGVIPVKFVIMEKRLNFLKYILGENISSMIRQVYEALKGDSRKGDFVSLIKTDMEELSIEITEEEIVSLKKTDWKKYVNEIIKGTAFVTLVNENKEKSRTKHIHFEKFEMSKYLVKNKNTSLSKIINRPGVAGAVLQTAS